MLGLGAGHIAGLSHLANGGSMSGYKSRVLAGAGLGTLAGGYLGYKAGSRFNKHIQDSDELCKRETEDIVKSIKRK